MNKLLKITCGCLLLFGVSAMTITTTGCSKEASNDMKQAGNEASNAAKHTGDAAKSEINKGADKVKKSTE